MVDISVISSVVTAMGLIVGVVFAILELRNLVKTRQTDLIMRLYSTFGTREFLGTFEKLVARETMDYRDYVKKYGMSEAWKVGLFFEGLGVLLHRKLIDIDLVDDLFTAPIKLSWESLKPIAKEQRKQFNQPQMYEWCEYLYNEMKKREQSRPQKIAS